MLCRACFSARGACTASVRACSCSRRRRDATSAVCVCPALLRSHVPNLDCVMRSSYEPVREPLGSNAHDGRFTCRLISRLNPLSTVQCAYSNGCLFDGDGHEVDYTVQESGCAGREMMMAAKSARAAATASTVAAPASRQGACLALLRRRTTFAPRRTTFAPPMGRGEAAQHQQHRACEHRHGTRCCCCCCCRGRLDEAARRAHGARPACTRRKNDLCRAALP